MAPEHRSQRQQHPDVSALLLHLDIEPGPSFLPLNLLLPPAPYGHLGNIRGDPTPQSLPPFLLLSNKVEAILPPKHLQMKHSQHATCPELTHIPLLTNQYAL